MDFSVAFESLTQGMVEFSRKRNKKTEILNEANKEIFSDAKLITDFRERNSVKIECLKQGHKRMKINYPLLFSFNQLTSEPYSFPSSTLEVIRALEYNSPTPVQSEIIPLFSMRHHMLVSAPTGSGKTAAYLLPVLNAIADDPLPRKLSAESDTIRHSVKPRCIILSTTQELLRQIWTEAIKLGHNMYPKNGKIVILQKKHYQNKKPKNVAELSKRKTAIRELRLPADSKIIITTPKRLENLVSKKGARCPIIFDNLHWLIVDECDKMLEENIGSGANLFKTFRIQLTAVLNGIRDSLLASTGAKSRFPTVALFSATMPPQVIDWAVDELSEECNESRNLVQVKLGITNAAVSTVKQELKYCGTEQGKLLEIRRLLINGLFYPCLIFTESRVRANELFKEITLSGKHAISVNILSSEKTEGQREETVRAFREGRINVLICTDILGRGMDFKGLAMVVNYDLPPSSTEYIHRVGRTGRAGQPGHSITLWTDSDLCHLQNVLDVMKCSGADVDEDLQRLVLAWKLKKSKQMHSKSIGGIVSCRRGERRLAAKVSSAKTNDKLANLKNRKNKFRSRQKQLLRPWNPHREKISDVPGSLARKARILRSD